MSIASSGYRQRRSAIDVALRYEPGMQNITHTRSSTATYIDHNGDTQTASVNELRDDHWIEDPVTGLWTRTTLLELTDEAAIDVPVSLQNWAQQTHYMKFRLPYDRSSSDGLAGDPGLWWMGNAGVGETWMSVYLGEESMIYTSSSNKLFMGLDSGDIIEVLTTFVGDGTDHIATRRNGSNLLSKVTGHAFSPSDDSPDPIIHLNYNPNDDQHGKIELIKYIAIAELLQDTDEAVMNQLLTA